MALINGFRKELLFYMRGGRLITLVIVMIALAVMSPLMFGMTSQMMQMMKEAMPDGSYSELAEEFSSFSASDIAVYNSEYICGIGAIIILFIFKAAAGGEQKKRSVIIPQCAGISPERYVLPKFIIYPLSIFAVSFLAVVLGAAVSAAMFPGGLDWSMIMLSAFATGVFLAFCTALQFCVGLSTGKSNAAVVIVIAMQMFLPTILAMFRVDRFNPLALSSISLAAARASGRSGSVLLSTLDAAGTSNDLSSLNVAVSFGTAIVISVILYFVTVFALHTKEVHNEGNEPVL